MHNDHIVSHGMSLPSYPGSLNLSWIGCRPVVLGCIIAILLCKGKRLSSALQAQSMAAPGVFLRARHKFEAH